jgi:hypothetical protein
MTGQIAGQQLGKFALRVHYVNVGTMIDRVLAFAQAAWPIIDVERLGRAFDVVRLAAQSDNPRVEGLHVRSHHFHLVAGRIERDEYCLEILGLGAECIERGTDLIQGRGADIGTKRVTEIDQQPFAVEIGVADLLSIERRQCEMAGDRGRRFLAGRACAREWQAHHRGKRKCVPQAARNKMIIH